MYNIVTIGGKVKKSNTYPEGYYEESWLGKLRGFMEDRGFRGKSGVFLDLWLKIGVFIEK